MVKICWILALLFMICQPVAQSTDCIVESILKYDSLLNGKQLNETEKLLIAIDFTNCFWRWARPSWIVECSVHNITECLAGMTEYQHQTFEYFYDHLDDALVLAKTFSLQLHVVNSLQSVMLMADSSVNSISRANDVIDGIARMQLEMLNLTLPQFRILTALLSTRLQELIAPVNTTAAMLELIAGNVKVVVSPMARPLVEIGVIALIIGATFSWRACLFIYLIIGVVGVLISTGYFEASWWWWWISELPPSVQLCSIVIVGLGPTLVQSLARHNPQTQQHTHNNPHYPKYLNPNTIILRNLPKRPIVSYTRLGRLASNHVARSSDRKRLF